VIKSRIIIWVGHTAHMVERRRAYKVLVAQPEGERPLGRPRHTWGNNIKMNLQSIGWKKGLNWNYLAQDRDRWWDLVNAVMNLQVA
jgi:hypothetical protein